MSLWPVDKTLVCCFKQDFKNNSLKISRISEEAQERIFFDEDDSFAGLENMQEDLVNNLESNLIFFKETCR